MFGSKKESITGFRSLCLVTPELDFFPSECSRQFLASVTGVLNLFHVTTQRFSFNKERLNKRGKFAEYFIKLDGLTELETRINWNLRYLESTRTLTTRDGN